MDDVHSALSKLSTTKAGTFDAIVLTPEWRNEDCVAKMHPIPGTIHYFHGWVSTIQYSINHSQMFTAVWHSTEVTDVGHNIRLDRRDARRHP